MIDWTKVQGRLGVTADGIPGPNTYAALLERVAGQKVKLGRELAAGLTAHLPTYEVTTAKRLAAFLAQAAHESAGFVHMEELGGRAYFQRYEGRRDLGNTEPGDGARFHGRGLIQLTGRANYAEYGKALGLDLVHRPAIAAEPSKAVLVALEYWKRKGLNALADRDLFETITRRINGGLNGLDDRLAYHAKAWAVLS